MQTAKHTDLLAVMQSRLGIQEVPGRENNPTILQWFADVGHPEIEADEVSWCAITIGSALKECGLPIPPRDVNMLARSYLTYGVKCEPQPGAIAIWPRGKSSWQGHVNIVESVTDDGKVICIGGNQSKKGGDAVTRTKPLDPAGALDFRMPIKPTVPDLRKAGSTEVKKGDRVQNLGIFATFFAPIIAVFKEMFAAVPEVPQIATIPEGLTYTQQLMEGANAVGRLVLDNPWLAGTVIVGGILAWVGHGIKAARVRKAQDGIPLSVEVAAMGSA